MLKQALKDEGCLQVSKCAYRLYKVLNSIEVGLNSVQVSH